MRQPGRYNFSTTQWIFLGMLAVLAIAALCTTSLVIGNGVLNPPTPTPTPFVFPATWTPAPTPTMIVPTKRVTATPEQ